MQDCSDCLWAHGFRYCFTPLSGCFSPFPHGTGSLSVTGECSALEGGPPLRTGFHVPALLGMRNAVDRFRVRGSPLRPALPCRSATCRICNRSTEGSSVTCVPTPGRQRLPLTRARVWAGALSLAATRAISVDSLSSGYLDVSVPRLPPTLFHSGVGTGMTLSGFPIRRPADQGCLPSRSLSQLAASFVDFLCQGIRRAPWYLVIT